ncbi:MAG: glycosyltransferase family 4 protein [Anaerolineaceae bacterium]|jgi:glycosyltransferase involved in cell wall biosynthesis|nr:glycosyltransferase family 4 protein [Anaerolineaceae bacterium]
MKPAKADCDFFLGGKIIDMKILLINQVFVSPDEPGHTRHYEMAKYLQNIGDELVIVASDLNYQTGQRTVDHKGLVTEQVIAGVRVLRTYIYPAIHRSYFWRILSFFSFMFSSIIAAMRVRDVDIIMGTSPPIFQAFSAWVVAFLRRKPFLLEIRDLWPEFIVSMGVFNNPILIKLARMLEMFLYRRATHILVNSPAYKDYIAGKGISASKITFIPYGADIQMFHPGVDGSSIRQELNLQGKFLVLYTGALGQANDIYTILRAASHLKEEKAIQFVVFGDGKERPKLQAQAHKLQLDNLLFAGVRPKHQMPAIIAASDLCLAILQDVPMFRTTYPNKVFDYMAAGKPTLLVIDGVIRQVIEESQSGIYVRPGDDQQLANTIRSLSTQPDQLKWMGNNARTYLEKHLDRQIMLEKTRDLFLQLRKQ